MTKKAVNIYGPPGSANRSGHGHVALSNVGPLYYTRGPLFPSFLIRDVVASPTTVKHNLTVRNEQWQSNLQLTASTSS